MQEERAPPPPAYPSDGAGDRPFTLEATVGIEPTIGVLQTPALTTWPRRQKKWSGRRDSNSRPPPWQGGALPLSHFRSRPFGTGFVPYADFGSQGRSPRG